MFYINVYYWLGFRTRSISVAYEYYKNGTYDFCAVVSLGPDKRYWRIDIFYIDVHTLVRDRYSECICQFGPERLRHRICEQLIAYKPLFEVCMNAWKN